MRIRACGSRAPRGGLRGGDLSGENSSASIDAPVLAALILPRRGDPYRRAAISRRRQSACGITQASRPRRLACPRTALAALRGQTGSGRNGRGAAWGASPGAAHQAVPRPIGRGAPCGRETDKQSPTAWSDGRGCNYFGERLRDGCCAQGVGACLSVF